MTKLCDINAAAKEKLPPGFAGQSGIVALLETAKTAGVKLKITDNEISVTA